VVRGHYRVGGDSEREALYTRWSFVGLHLRGRDVRVFCVPTSTGVVLFVASGGTCRCLPTYGAQAREVRGRDPGRGPADDDHAR